MLTEGNRLYSAVKDLEREILDFCLAKADQSEDALISEIEARFKTPDLKANLKKLVKKRFIEILETPSLVVKVLKNPGGGEYIPPLREELCE